MKKLALLAVLSLCVAGCMGSEQAAQPQSPAGPEQALIGKPKPCALCQSYTDEANDLLGQDPGSSGWCDEAGAFLDDTTYIYQQCLETMGPLCTEFVEVYEALFNMWWSNC
ncbi:MAG TPA: hypothetical protein VKU85_05105 [bacterium]|nr:hypothetical protein [bacterium]